MARQISPLGKIKGKVDQMSYTETADGYITKKTPRYSKDKFKTAESYDLVRRNASEFGIAGVAGRVFRSAWNTEVNKAADSRLTSRVTRTMVKVLQTDTVSEYGSRRVENGDLTMLKGLDFNRNIPFSALMSDELEVTIGRPTGQAVIIMQPFIPRNIIAAPSGATHFSFFAAAAAIDFETGISVVDRAITVDLPWNMTQTTVAPIELTLPAASTLPLFVVVGIEFKKVVNGTAFEITDNACASRVLAVSMP